MKKRVGVLALQGTFPEHRQTLESLGCDVVEVRKTADLAGLHGLIIPGADMTTLGKLLSNDGLGDKIKELATANFPIFGIDEGMIILSKNNDARDPYRLGLMDVTVGDPTLGNPLHPLETELQIPALGAIPVRTVFSRAPLIRSVAPNVGILAEFEGKIVFVRQGNMIGCSFHPELTPDQRVHRYFLDIVDEEISK